MKARRIFSGLAVSAVLGLVSASADVRLPAVFSDHMVLQRGKPYAVWGWADPGEKVTVTVAGKSKSTKAGSDGRWTVALPGIQAGGPHVLEVAGNNRIAVRDVLVGEVWLGSGQSNMGMTVDRCKDFDAEKARAVLPDIRMFTVERHAVPVPQTDCKGSWVVCSPETVGGFSAALYFHGRELHARLGVPMGLINSSWGGTPIEAWTGLEIQSGPAFESIHEPWKKQLAEPWNEAKAQADYEKQTAAWKKASAKAKAEGKPAPRAPQKPSDPAFSHHRPANLFNGMIAPIIPYTLRGAVWYQGENNAIKPTAPLYGFQLRTMVRDWRRLWKDEFPFAWVQLPEYRAPQKEPSEPGGWVTVREEMLKSLVLPKTGMAVTLGLGEANDIHPKNKQDVGRRLAAWAMADVYKQKGAVGSGPLPSGHRIRGNEIVVSFRNAAGGLTAPDGELKGFAVAGEDRRFVWANARLEGDTVVIWHPDVPYPAAARYAWAENPVFSLYNGAGLPATPFRTDNW